MSTRRPTDKWRTAIVGALRKATGCARIFERSDSDVRKLEGLEPVSGWLLGEGDTRAVIEENGIKLVVDIAGGHMPLCNEAETIWIAYNGEVYNAPALRTELGDVVKGATCRPQARDLNHIARRVRYSGFPADWPAIPAPSAAGEHAYVDRSASWIQFRR